MINQSKPWLHGGTNKRNPHVMHGLLDLSGARPHPAVAETVAETVAQARARLTNYLGVVEYTSLLTMALSLTAEGASN